MSIEVEKNGLSSFLLGSILTSYPDAYFKESVATLLEDESLVLPLKLKQSLESLLLLDDKIMDLQSDYIDIFDRSRSINPIYETEYGKNRSLGKANELSDIAGFYSAFGFELGDDNSSKEMHDHVSVELEFYSLLMIKSEYLRQELNDLEGLEIVIDARKKFLQDHLGRFVETIATRPGVQINSFYGEMFKWLSKLVEDECRFLEVTPLSAQWFASEIKQNESMACCGLDNN